jgi:S1-C subfamily serine protease
VKQEKKAGGKVTLGPIVQHTATSSHGSSGSPLVNLAGEVVAVQHSGLDGTGIAFAAHVDLLRALVAKTNLDAAPKKLGPNLTKNLAISAAVFGVPAVAFVAVQLVLRLRRRRPKAKAPRAIH